MSIYKEKFSGVFPAVLTPINKDLSCNYDELANHINELINAGCKGVVLFGTNGESTSFSVRERIDTIKSLIQRGIDPDFIIVGSGCCSIDDTVVLSRASVELKCSSVLIHPPFFFKNLHDEGVINFYREVIKNVSKPELKLFLYHIPQVTCAPVSLYVIESLIKEFPETVIGIKDSHGVHEYTRNILQQFPDFVVFLGSETQIPEFIRLGATGVVSGTSNVCPELFINQLEFGKGSNKSLKDREDDILKHHELIKGFYFISAFKGILASRKGENWKFVRPPLKCLSDDEIDFLSEDRKSVV